MTIPIVLLTELQRAQVKEIRAKLDALGREIEGRRNQQRTQQEKLDDLLRQISADGSPLYLKFSEENEQRLLDGRRTSPKYLPILSEDGQVIIIREDKDHSIYD